MISCNLCAGSGKLTTGDGSDIQCWACAGSGKDDKMEATLHKIESVKNLKAIFTCGRSIGRASNWQPHANAGILIYDFHGAEGYVGPEGTILIDFENGTIQTLSDDGSVNVSVDLINAIKNCLVHKAR